MSTIVVYASTGGNTSAVAEYIAEKTGGRAVSVKDVKVEDVSACDTVIVGTRIHAGLPAKEIESFVKGNRDLLDSKKTALFLCCMYNDDKGAKQCEKVAGLLGIPVSAFFNKGKRVLKGDTADVDAFIERIA